eukprot:9927865-Alexandrium_andersonii.AAC.1
MPTLHEVPSSRDIRRVRKFVAWRTSQTGVRRTASLMWGAVFDNTRDIGSRLESQVPTSGVQT